MQSPQSDLTPWTLTLISNLIVAKNGGNAQLGFEYRLLDGPSDLLGTLYAPVSKIPSVKGNLVVFRKNQLNRL